MLSPQVGDMMDLCAWPVTWGPALYTPVPWASWPTFPPLLFAHPGGHLPTAPGPLHLLLLLLLGQVSLLLWCCLGWACCGLRWGRWMAPWALWATAPWPGRSFVRLALIAGLWITRTLQGA